MAKTSFTGLKRYRSRSKRRSTSNVKKARYQAPTARNQKRQIIHNAKDIRRLRSLLPPVVFTDYQYKQEVLATISEDGLPTLAIQSYVLTDFSKWSPVLRISPSVQDAVATQIMRFNINMRYSLVNSDYAQISIFICTMRKDHANRDPTVSPLQSGSDFIVGNDLLNARLNPAIFKCHYVRNITLTKNALFTPPIQQNNQPAFASDPFSTYKKGNINIRPNIRVRSPAIETWKALPYGQLPFYQRYFLLTFINSNNSAAIAAGTQARIDMDFMATCKNSA